MSDDRLTEEEKDLSIHVRMCVMRDATLNRRLDRQDKMIAAVIALIAAPHVPQLLPLLATMARALPH
jgi:hypothetical protein